MVDRETIKIIIAGGGTGGHLYPGIALAQKFEEKWQARILFVGTAYGIENKILPQMPYDFKRIWMRGLQRKLSLSNLLFPLRLFVSLLQCGLLVLSFRPDLIVGTGGYVSGPALMAGIVFGVPTIIQEQNSYPGLVNRLLGNRVDQVHVTFEASLPHFKKQAQIYVSGNPVRGEFNSVDKENALAKFNLKNEKITLFVFGGSQGAHAINGQVLKSLEPLMNIEELQILWATGMNDWETIRTSCANYRERVSVHAYIEDMAAAYSAADFVLCRSGASTLAEIAICGLPAILVPYPYAAAGHQEFNAQAAAEKGAAVVILEKVLSQETLVASVSDLIRNQQKRQSMSQAALQMAKPEAAEQIAEKMAVLLK